MLRADGPAHVTREQAQLVVSDAGVDARVISTSLLGEGVKSVVTRIDLEDADPLALKVFIRGGSTTREHRAYELLGEHRLPLPRMLLGVAATEEFPFGYTLLTIAPGEPLNQNFVGLPRADLLEIYRGVGKFQRALHRNSAAGFSELSDRLYEPDNGGLIEPRVERGLATFLTHGGSRRLAGRLERFFASYKTQLDKCTSPELCHGDLHPENIRVVREEGGLRFAFAIDLEEAFAGDPVMDLVRTLQTCPLPGQDLTAAFLDGYGGKPQGFDELFDVYYVLYELELWNFYAQGGSRKPLRSIAKRMRGRIRS